MNPKLPREPKPFEVLRLFRAGYSTFDIARILFVTEPAVARVLHQAREAHRAKISATLSPERKPPVAGDGGGEGPSG